MSYRPLVVRKGGVYVGTLNGVVDIGNVFTVGTDANGGITLDLSLTSASVGLGNVTNTSDANKPVSTAQQTALNLKANLAGPTFTGIPLAPTASNGTNTTQIATTGFTQNTVSTYVRSRGENLVTNGTALLGNNFNFTGFAFNGADTYNGGGSFEVTSLPGVKTSDELLPVNSDNRYRLTAYGRWTGGAQQPNIYIGLASYDIDGNAIGPGHYMRQSDDVLAAPLKPGDTTMTVATPSSWNNAAGVDTRLRTVVVWGYKNSFGYKYPAYTYSRFSIPNAYADGGVNSSTGVITLAAPFPAGYGNPDDANGIWPTGTPVSNGSSGGTYQYIAAGGTPVPQTWTKYSGTIQGIETSGNTATTKFPPATSAIKILFLVNYGTTVAQTTRVSNIEFALDTLGGVGSGLDADTLDGFQGSYFAPVASPSLTGIPLAPTATAGTNTTQLATTAFVTTALSNGAPTKTGVGASGSWAISVTGSAATLTTARTISTTGDATWTTTFNGSANVTGALTLATVATPGTYRSVTVNAKGLVTSGTNPTTLSGYGITDAAPSARQVVAGNGVTGGGALTADVTLTLGTPSTITSATTNAVTATSHTHALTVTKADVGLANVDNTSDLSKPVSTATQTALDLKANATAPSFTGTMTMTGHIIPATDITYDLGSPTKMWRDLYVGPGSIYMNGKKILEDNSNTITFSTDDNQNLRIETAGTGNLEMKTGIGGAIMMQGTINVSSGKKIIDSAGIKIEFGDDIDVGNNFVISTPIPTAVSHLTNKAYVDSLTTGDATIVRTAGTQTIGGNKTFTGDVVLSGNLTINGTTTTINTETISLADNIIELNSNFTAGTPTENSGFVVRRGDLGTVSWVWDEANDRFTAINGSNALQDLYVGAITATTYNGITKTTVGLANVDNTSDVNKPVSTAQQTALDLKAPLASPTFTGTVSGITKTMVGLANVDNTADTAKPVSTAQQTALNLKANIASPTFTGTTTTAILTATGLVTTPASVAGSAGFNVPPGVAPTTPVNGDIWTTTAGGVFARVNGVTQNLVPTTQLASYATLASPTFTGTVGGITAAMVGLGNVNNTADSAKPVSTAQQTALDLKAPLASPTFTGTVSGVTKTMVGLGSVDNTADTAKPVSTAQQTALNLKANLASPTFTGTVSGITAAMVGLANVNNTTDTNKPVSTAQQAALDLKANLNAPAFTGVVDFSGTTSIIGLSKASFGLGNADNTSDVNKPVSTAQQTALDLKANSASPTFTGTVTAPTFVGTLTGVSSRTNTVQAVDNRKVLPPDVIGNTGAAGYGMRSYFSSKTGMDTGTAGTDYVDVLSMAGYSDPTGGLVNAISFSKALNGGIFHYQAAQNGTAWNAPKQIAYTDSSITGNATTATLATNATTLATARTIALSGAATGTATSFNGSANITIPVTSLNAPNLTGIVPNANLSGLYDGVTIKATGNNVLFTDVSVGSTSANGRTVYGLASYEAYNGTSTGAIVFYAPSSAVTVMHMLEINGFLYSTAQAVKIVTNGYRWTSVAFANVSATNYGNVSIPVRWAIDPAGKTCIILGDVTTTWSYPHFTISTAMISAGVTDAYCVGWTTALVTDLSTYTQITTATEKPSVVTALNATSSTSLTTARTIAISGIATGTATSFNGSANITIPVTSLDLTNAGMTGVLGVDHGSTGQSAYAIGDMLYASGTTALSKLSAGSANQVLQANGAGVAPSWTTLDMSYMPDSVFKKSVKAATTANITLSAPQTIDGVSLIAGDRVLVKNQTTSAQNGIWAVAAAAWIRVADADISSEIAGAVVSVDQGAINGGLLFTNTFKTTDTLGTTAMVWQTVTTNEATQTLTNKTLTSPTITNPSFTGVTNFPASNAQIEIGAQGTANTPFIDFHSGATTTDYDSRIIASGGTGVTGAGTLTLTAATVATTSNLNVGGIITGNLTGNVTGNVSGSSGSTTGNSATATILQTARTISIAGAVSGTATSFNGSANISIPITSVDLTSTAYAGILGVDHGSTGIGAYAVGDLLQASGTTALARLPAVATGNVLLSGGVSTASSWGKVGLTTHVTGALPIVNGGTGTTTAAGGLTALGGVAKAGDTMTGALNFAAEATLASASTTSIGAANSNNIYITGSATITSLGVGTIGMTRKVRFAGNAVLAYSATFMILIGGVTFITQPNDCAEFMCIGTSNWIMTDYIRATASVDGVAALGGGTDRVFYENDQTVNSSYSITAGRNAMTAGPITINNGAIVTVPNGSVWSIV